LDYKVNIRYLIPKNNKVKEEIWAEIFNYNSGEIMKKLIWWRDNKGLFHDESSNLPIKYRDMVDTAWISAAKKM
jgi:hypothetical protein